MQLGGSKSAMQKSAKIGKNRQLSATFGNLAGFFSHPQICTKSIQKHVFCVPHDAAMPNMYFLFDKVLKKLQKMQIFSKKKLPGPGFEPGTLKKSKNG